MIPEPGTGAPEGPRARVVMFVAGGPIALEALGAVAARHTVALVVQPGPAPTMGWSWRRTAGRVVRALGLRAADPVVTWARERGIPTFTMPRARTPDALDSLRAARADVAAIATWPRRLTGDVRQSAAPICLNTHPSLLPRHRGAGALFWMYHAGDASGGVTVHEAADALDAGDIFAQVQTPIARGESLIAVHARCAALGGVLLADAIDAVAHARSHAIPQDAAAATHAPAVRERVVRSQLASWDAAHAWHFLAGVLPVYRDPLIDADGKPVPYGSVEGFEVRDPQLLPGTVHRSGSGWNAWTRDGLVRLAPGVTPHR